MWLSAVVHILGMLCLITLTGCVSTGSVESHLDKDTYFYKPARIGSESLYNPLSNNLSYALDSLKLSDNFGTDNFDDDLSAVWYRLQHPRSTIENGGGTRKFINREIFPIDSDGGSDSAAMLPNYALHLLGGGVVFRKELEWFRTRDYPYPALTATTLAIISELVQEAIEDEDVIDTDALADFYIFRPLGLLLFSSDRIAGYIQRVLEPAIWPSLQSIDLNHRKIINAGISYVYRPPRLAFGKQRVFIYTGLNNLIGLSHQLPFGDKLSWGVGASVKEVTSQRTAEVELKPSSGLFYDRNNSLIWSVLLNDTGTNRFRVNVYPRGITLVDQVGYFISVDDNSDLSAGISYRLPLGVGASE